MCMNPWYEPSLRQIHPWLCRNLWAPASKMTTGFIDLYNEPFKNWVWVKSRTRPKNVDYNLKI